MRYSALPPRLGPVARRAAPLGVVLVVAGALHVGFGMLDRALVDEYKNLASMVEYDRSGAVVYASLNPRGAVSLREYAFPEPLTHAVLAKEDAWFYFHPGLHPYRIAAALVYRVRGQRTGGASTITQQLAKNLLNTGRERTLRNKAREALAALALEYHHSKDEILTMYLNTAPLGGTAAGFPAAARAYYGKRVDELSDTETLALIAALSNPSAARPYSALNKERSSWLARVLGYAPPVAVAAPQKSAHSMWLELMSVRALTRYGEAAEPQSGERTTLDARLTENIRALLARHVEGGSYRRMTHGAVVVIDAHTNELLALVGSPKPESDAPGMKINMALERRPVGSTIKPFLYLKGFERGLRPYSEVEDREYKYGINTGFALYPKNYDGTYRGTVTLEEALANSLNVPTVVVTRFLTLPDVYRFLADDLGFVPTAPWESYAYGIALGGLELDLLTLTHAYTALAHSGELGSLTIGRTANGAPVYALPPSSRLRGAQHISRPEYVALVNSILTDRTAGVEQFGLTGPLTLSRGGYAVKTGTSRDYHDSWTVGYTGDFVVGVWVGNSENRPMRTVTGAAGAGSLWRNVMELMFTTAYHKGTPLPMPGIVPVPSSRGVSYGLAGDDANAARTLLAERSLVLFPHDGDELVYEPGMRVPLSAAREASWTINGAAYTPTREGWYPKAPGTYELTARDAEGASETIRVRVLADPTTLP